MREKAVFTATLIALALSMLVICVPTEAITQYKSAEEYSESPLRFPIGNYTVHTITVTTPSSKTTVVYLRYHHIPYVANPVDLNYQSMDVGVPVKINDTYVDAKRAPILLIINVGGYRSFANTLGGVNGMPLTDVAIMPPRVAGPALAALALASGYVVVVPGVRGWDCQFPNGTYYGKAPAAIIDLKAAVRYIRYNRDMFPGNPDWIIATGGSAGGALAALLAASGDSPLYKEYLDQVGAAKTSDRIFASAPFCPITDLEHADIAYEWEFGRKPLPTGVLVNQTVSRALAALFPEYIASLNLRGKGDFGIITADNYGKYINDTYLIPAATEYINSLPEPNRTMYLAANPWIKWSENRASFTFEDYVQYHIPRLKGCPAFDSFTLTTPENYLFGNKTVHARHYTDFSLRYATGNLKATIAEYAPDLPLKVYMMNPMNFILRNWTGCAQYWRIRTGSKDNHAAITMWTNLAISLENIGKTVDFAIYWEGGHSVNYDPWNLMTWIRQITGYKLRAAHVLAVGLGFIDSPKGAYAGNPQLSGKSIFCFAAYAKDTLAGGNLRFTFYAAQFRFRSVSCDWIVITNKVVQLRGIGTVVGREDIHRFIIWAVDSDHELGYDMLRVKIWKEINGTEYVIYDSGLSKLFLGGITII